MRADVQPALWKLGLRERVPEALGDLRRRHQARGGRAFLDAGGDQFSSVSVEGADAPLPFSDSQPEYDRPEHEVIRKRGVQDFSGRPFGEGRVSRERWSLYINNHRSASYQDHSLCPSRAIWWRAIEGWCPCRNAGDAAELSSFQFWDYDSTRKSARSRLGPSAPNSASIAACSRCQMGSAAPRRLRPSGGQRQVPAAAVGRIDIHGNEAAALERLYRGGKGRTVHRQQGRDAAHTRGIGTVEDINSENWPFREIERTERRVKPASTRRAARCRCRQRQESRTRRAASKVS